MNGICQTREEKEDASDHVVYIHSTLSVQRRFARPQKNT